MKIPFVNIKKIEKTVAGVMEAFHTAIADLEEIESAQTAEAQRQQDIELKAKDAATAASNKVKEAAGIRKKLENLVTA